MTSQTDFTSSQAGSSGCMSPGNNTFGQTATGSQSDEEPPPARRQSTTFPQTPRTEGALDGGQQFKMKMAAVIGLRGMQKDDNFELATSVTDAGKFNDIVCTTNGRRYYLKLEYTEDPDKDTFTPQKMVKLLHQCFESYYNIQDRDKSEFLIYTNKQRRPKLSSYKIKETKVDTVEEIFKTSANGEIFNFARDNNTKIDVYSGVEKNVKESKGFRNLSDSEQNCKVSMMSKFLEKLIMVTGQNGEGELDYVIIKEIKKQDAIKVGDEMYKRELHTFKNYLQTWWWWNRNEKITTQILKTCLQEAKTACCTSLVSSLFDSCKTNLAETGVKFSHSKISLLLAEISNKPAVHLRSDALTLCSKLLLDCLPESKCIFVTFASLQSHINMLLHAWLGGHWEWLIVYCDSTVQQSDISDKCLNMSEVIKPDRSSKRVIILTEYSVQQITGFVPIDHRFKFEQLSDESQAMVLDKKIDFQGCEVTMRSVLQQHGNVEHVLGPELVTDLITEGTAVNIGGKLHVNTGYYAHRVLERNVWLHSNVLRNPSGVFAVSGTTKKEVYQILPSDEILEFDYLGDNFDTDFTESLKSRIFLLRDEDVEDSLLEICKRIKGKSLHWVEFNNGGLLWKMSRGGTDSLLDYVDVDKTRADKRIIAECMKSGSCEVNEESIWDLGERTVLVVAEPGMGKSSTTTQVAWRTKQRDPTSWVVRINWNDHTRKLMEINAETFNLDTLVEFLCSVAFPDSKYTHINRSLLQEALQSNGNVTVLMDGFDEISPTYADKAAVILSELTKTKVGRVWVTSRPVEKERLEKKLSVIAYGMKNLSRTSQEDMLLTLWKIKAGEEGLRQKLLAFIEDYLSHLNDFCIHENFTGCPLYIEMIATVYEVEMETCLISDVYHLPRIDLDNLYEKFVERKLHIYLTQKQKADITNSSVLDNLEILKEAYLIYFEKCAVAAILPAPMIESLHNNKIEDEILKYLDRVQAGKDKTGIVMEVVKGKPQFVHRTFAEFFTARWFSKNFESNRSVLEDILFDNKYSFVGAMFDRMLTKDCPLHCAVLEQDDMGRVRRVLEEGCDVNDVDKGGRIITHIIAMRNWLPVMILNLVCDNGVSFDKKDCVLQWTPLQYAIKAEKWLRVEWLLKRNVDRSGLDMIRQRAHDPGYIGPIIMESAQVGYLLLLEFIRSIGVNIHQASYRIFHSPLHAALQTRQLEVVRWLIKHGANCNTRYSDGQTLLFNAVTNGSLDVVQVLVEEGGASLDVRDDCGRTVIDWAKRNARTDIAKYLEERECRVNQCTAV